MNHEMKKKIILSHYKLVKYVKQTKALLACANAGLIHLFWANQCQLPVNAHLLWYNQCILLLLVNPYWFWVYQCL